ncbi:MAG: LytR/AlgR family response regulator transcription factor [Bacteroidales bacterium]
MKVVILEDEKLAASSLSEMLLKIDPGFEIQGMIGSVRKAVYWFESNSCDLAFFDIHLSDGLVFTLFEKVNISCPVIFTTAYDQYAIRAFKVNSIDYLLKPIDEEELQKALEKYNSLQSKCNIEQQNLHELIKILGPKKEYKKRFMVHAGQKIRSVSTDDIAYFHVAEKSVFLSTFEGKTYPADATLEIIESLVDPSVFFRVNRQYLVNIKSIRDMYTLSRSRIKLELSPSAPIDVMVSFTKLSSFRKWLDQ